MHVKQAKSGKKIADRACVQQAYQSLWSAGPWDILEVKGCCLETDVPQYAIITHGPRVGGGGGQLFLHVPQGPDAYAFIRSST